MRLFRTLCKLELAKSNLVKRARVGGDYREVPFPYDVIITAGSIAALSYFIWFVEDAEYNRRIRFRDKSALFKGINPDPENNPSWGDKEYKYYYSYQKD